MSEVSIDLQPGETIDQAILRMAGNGPNKPLAVANEQNAVKTPKAKKITVSDPSAGQPVDREICSAIHTYMMPGESEAQVRFNGTRERRMHGPAVAVFVHMHSFGEECTAACKERMAE